MTENKDVPLLVFVWVFVGLLMAIFFAKCAGKSPQAISECVAKHQEKGVCLALKSCKLHMPKSCYVLKEDPRLVKSKKR